MRRNAGWYRFYERMIDSPQVLELSDAEFRLLVSVWCLASAQPDELRGSVQFTPRALQRRVLPTATVDEVAAMLGHFVALELIEREGDTLTVTRWDEHQRDPKFEPFGAVRAFARRWFRTVVFERDQWRCVVCGSEEKLTIDHITPLSKGGSNDLDNLQTLCKPCNSRKGAR